MFVRTAKEGDLDALYALCCEQAAHALPQEIFSAIFSAALHDSRRRLVVAVEDAQIVGYADLALAELLDPPLTTIRQNGFEVGRAAAEILLKRIYGSAEPPVHRRLPVEIKIRSSAAPVLDETERR